MEEEFIKRLAVLEEKIDGIYKAVNQMRKIFLWTFILSISLVIIPLVGLIFLLPSFLESLTSVGAF